MLLALATVFSLCSTACFADYTSFSRNERKVTKSFKNTQTDYNVFPYEVTGCTGCSFNYKANRSAGSKVSCTGTRDFYVRDKQSEARGDDSGWIYVGSFEYPREGETVSVDLTWPATDVYAAAVVRRNLDSGASFTASWGDSVYFYYGSCSGQESGSYYDYTKRGAIYDTEATYYPDGTIDHLTDRYGTVWYYYYDEHGKFTHRSATVDYPDCDWGPKQTFSNGYYAYPMVFGHAYDCVVSFIISYTLTSVYSGYTGSDFVVYVDEPDISKSIYTDEGHVTLTEGEPVRINVTVNGGRPTTVKGFCLRPYTSSAYSFSCDCTVESVTLKSYSYSI